MNKARKYRYNNSLLGTPDYDKLRESYTDDPIDYESQNSLQLFNSKEMKDLSIMLRFIYMPFFNDWLDKYTEGLESMIDSIKNVLVMLIILFSILLVCIFIFFWKPFENKLNKTVSC